ncbi:MAG: ABC transporter ATP-binding protein [Vicinamibacterales bacterium]
MTTAIEVSGVSKSFRRYRADRPHTLQEVLAKGLSGVRSREHFWALRDVSFRVGRGRAVGVIGTNGSGKSTLLRLVGGIGRADAGRIAVAGRIGVLLDLGSGFHGDLTGRENAIAGGVLNGLTRAEVLRRLDDIINFADIRPFIDNPMRTYSSGMQMRLAFSTAIHTDPEVLLIDEVLAVGDGAFQRKCLARISRFKERGVSLLLVSHGMGNVQEMCDEVMWLNGGQLMAHGPVADVVREYTLFLRRGSVVPVAKRIEADRNDGDADEAADEAAPGVRVRSLGLLDESGRPVELLPAGAPVRIAIDFHSVTPAPLFRVRLTREDGLVCLDVRTDEAVEGARAASGDGQVSLVLDRLDLNSGRYRVDLWAYARDWIQVDDHWVTTLPVLGDGLREAALNAPHRWEATTAAAATEPPRQRDGVLR